ncbi:hypothetical protein ABZ379_33870 [Streptomyces canus]|uniref:hypothetical protein n=1 Tax=Streptomyces canus TaxID=58343 RepID=UPI0033EB24C9
MCNQDGALPPQQPTAPWGHSAAAHRAFGWCADCNPVIQEGVGEELVAWRTRENRRHEAYQAALAASRSNPPTVDLAATHDHLCPACGQEALTLVTVRLTTDSGEQRKAGGWAHCTACDATPHPTLEEPDRG